MICVMSNIKSAMIHDIKICVRFSGSGICFALPSELSVLSDDYTLVDARSKHLRIPAERLPSPHCANSSIMRGGSVTVHFSILSSGERRLRPEPARLPPHRGLPFSSFMAGLLGNVLHFAKHVLLSFHCTFRSPMGHSALGAKTCYTVTPQ